jgi:hypothetical protein
MVERRSRKKGRRPCFRGGVGNKLECQRFLLSCYLVPTLPSPLSKHLSKYFFSLHSITKPADAMKAHGGGMKEITRKTTEK